MQQEAAASLHVFATHASYSSSSFEISSVLECCFATSSCDAAVDNAPVPISTPEAISGGGDEVERRYDNDNETRMVRLLGCYVGYEDVGG